MPDQYRRDLGTLGADPDTAERMVEVTTAAVQRIEERNARAHRIRNRLLAAGLAAAVVVLAWTLVLDNRKLDRQHHQTSAETAEILRVEKALQQQATNLGVDDAYLKALGADLAAEQQRSADGAITTAQYLAEVTRTLNAICARVRCGAPAIRTLRPPTTTTTTAAARPPPRATTTTTTAPPATTTTTVLLICPKPPLCYGQQGRN